MKRITDFEYSGKTVILRCDLNVPIKDNKILSSEKITASLETINYLLDKDSRVIILSHLGKVKEEKDKISNSLYLVYLELCKLLNVPVYFSSSTKGSILEDKINKLKPKEVLLVENTRYEELFDKAESSCNMELAKYWASFGDIFINDAFGTSHRKHASNYGISKFLPSGIGFLIQKEVNNLEKIVNPQKPFVAIMGGAKIDDKLDIIKNLLTKCDYLLVGGGIANSFVAVNNNVGNSLYNKDKLDELKDLLSIYKEKIILPVDFKVLNNEKVLERKITEIEDEDIIYDIGKETIKIYKDILDKANTIFINGTVGLYEDDRFNNGTRELLQYISSLSSVKIAGGGDAIASLEHFNIEKFDFKSTGGGATLEYIASGKLNCFDD